MPADLILTIILGTVVFLLFLTFISRYKRCPSNKILVIYGKTGAAQPRNAYTAARRLSCPCCRITSTSTSSPLSCHRLGQRAFAGKHPRIRAHHGHGGHLQPARHYAQCVHSPFGPVPR